MLGAWRGEHGSWCPGHHRPGHRAADLIVDHVVPLSAGGAPFDIANTAVLCRSCNWTKGASTDEGGGRVAHRATHLPAETAPGDCVRTAEFRELSGGFASGMMHER